MSVGNEPSLEAAASFERPRQDVVLRVENLGCEIATAGGKIAPLTGMSFDVRRGEILALVGESGSGKSLTALSIMGLTPPNVRITGGRILFDGHNLATATPRELRKIRGRRIGMIFQEPQSSLNPVLTIGRQLLEAIPSASGQNRRGRAYELLSMVGIPDPEYRFNQYPHQLSGGMKQRTMIAMAIAGSPDLLIADEPTTALDVTIQAQILDLLDDLRRRLGMAILLITHDLGVVAETADRIALTERGCVVELRSVRSFFARPTHRYGAELLAAAVELHGRQASTGANGAAPEYRRPVMLEVSDLCVAYKIGSNLFGGRMQRVVECVGFSLRAGETLALVGESGSGKSTVGFALVGLVPLESGTVTFDGQRLPGGSSVAARRHRAKLQIVFQDPYGSMDPRMTVLRIVEEGMVNLESKMRPAERRENVLELLDLVGLPKDSYRRYPHEFSGGQRQRISIARALALRPKAIVCDEVTSALDIPIRNQILKLLKAVQERLGVAYLFISHDLGTVKRSADSVAVMYLGRIVEMGPGHKVLQERRHPYTDALVAAEPMIDLTTRRRSLRLAGEPPSITAPPTGCHFHPRCPRALPLCRSVYPEPVEVGVGHMVRCHLYPPR